MADVSVWIVTGMSGAGKATALTALLAAETRLLQELRRPSDLEISDGIRYAVTPLFAATLVK